MISIPFSVTAPPGWRVFPDLPGLEYPIGMEPEFKVEEKETASGRSAAHTYWTSPRWYFTLSYEFLRERGGFDEMARLVGFYTSGFGRLMPFLFRDDSNFTATDSVFGLGDGTTRDFALTRTVGGIAEPVGAAIVSQIKIAGAPSTAWTLLDDRLIRFTVAPAAGAQLKWSGFFWLRCRFVDERLPVSEFMRKIWSAKSVKIKTDKA